MKNIKYLMIIVVLLSFWACKENDFDVDVSDINVDLEIYRFDEQFFSIPSDEIYYEIPKMQETYGEFFDIYNVELIGVGYSEQKDYFNNLSEFYNYCDQANLYADVQKVFPTDSKFLEKNLLDAFKHFRYYFPEKKIPKIITCISGFNLSVFTGNDFIGISLDKYLGTDYDIYSNMFEGYVARRMHKEMIPVDVMRAFCLSEFEFNDSVNTVLANSIFQGRIQYFLDAMLPETNDTLKWGYTRLQWGWANDFEENIWEFMVSEKIIFSNLPMDIKTYTGEAPFTTPFQNNSAPRAGSFIGYKIVESYMKNNSDITLGELMKERDYMKIYNASYYQP